MILDSSAIVAVRLREDSAPRVVEVMRTAAELRISAAAFVEASIVMARRRGDAGVAEVDELLSQVDVRIEAVTFVQARIARSAFLRFGKGRHPAALNFGDCFSYALAKSRHEPLLFIGDDFARTDVVDALR